MRLAEQTTAHAPLVISKSSSSWHASPNLPRARPDARDEDSGSKRLKFAETQVLPTDATVRADVNLSIGAGGAPETSDTNMAVESVLEGFEQARIANKLRDPALNHISNVASDGSLKLLVSTKRSAKKVQYDLMKVGSILEQYPHHGNLQSAKSDGHCESHGIDTMNSFSTFRSVA